MTSKRILFVICIALIAFPALLTGQDKDEAASIVKDAAIDGDPIAMSGYSYEMDFVRVKRLFIGKSRLRRKYKALLPTRIPVGRLFNHPLLLVFDSSKRLNGADIVEERRRIIEKLDAIDQENAARPEQDDDSARLDGYMTLRADSNTVGEQDLRIDLLQLLETASFSNLKRFDLNGRKTVSLEFQPSSTTKFDQDLFYLGQIEGIILIDELDRRVIRVEGFPVGGLKKYGSMREEKRSEFRVFHFLQMRMPEGVWFPDRAELNFMEFPDDFNQLAVKIEFSFHKYKRFSTAVESLNIDETEDPSESEPSLPQN